MISTSCCTACRVFVLSCNAAGYGTHGEAHQVKGEAEGVAPPAPWQAGAVVGVVHDGHPNLAHADAQHTGARCCSLQGWAVVVRVCTTGDDMFTMHMTCSCRLSRPAACTQCPPPHMTDTGRRRIQGHSGHRGTAAVMVVRDAVLCMLTAKLWRKKKVQYMEAAQQPRMQAAFTHHSSEVRGLTCSPAKPRSYFRGPRECTDMGRW